MLREGLSLDQSDPGSGIPAGFQGQKSFPQSQGPIRGPGPRGFGDLNPKCISCHPMEALS